MFVLSNRHSGCAYASFGIMIRIFILLCFIKRVYHLSTRQVPKSSAIGPLSLLLMLTEISLAPELPGPVLYLSKKQKEVFHEIRPARDDVLTSCPFGSR